ncbi:hypothetical protein AB3M93_16565 [Novosphingobium panipatense]|jgi:hypothetical protein|nr:MULTISPECIES: hypothetical protein [Novosphingobium]
MHIDTQGAQGRFNTATYPSHGSRDLQIKKPSGLLSQEHLRRLVAAMID